MQDDYLGVIEYNRESSKRYLLLPRFHMKSDTAKDPCAGKLTHYANGQFQCLKSYKHPFPKKEADPVEIHVLGCL